MLKIILSVICLSFAATSAHSYNSIPCPSPQPSDIVFIVAGQSNAGSYGDIGYHPGNSDISLYFGNGLCYPLDDALPGFPPPPMPGSGGSIWTRFSAIYHQKYPSAGRIIFVNIAENGVPILNWAQGHSDYPRIAQAISSLAANGWFHFKALLFMDGESDAMYTTSSGALATTAIQSMVDGIRAGGKTSPVVIATTTLCRFKLDATDAGFNFELISRYDASARIAQESDVQSALLAISDPVRNIMVGPNTDLIGANARWDHCHLSDYGQWLAAQLWVDRLAFLGVIP